MKKGIMDTNWRVQQHRAAVCTYRVVLVVAAACGFFCSISPVCCDIPNIGSAINIGTLSLDAAAVAKLSNSPNQAAWWQLADERWHDSAINRFFSSGPLNAAQMAKLAAESQNKDAWKRSGIHMGSNIDLPIQRLQQAATAEYKMSKSIAGTGDIEASMWTLMFQCMSSSCTDGYMVPIVVVPRDQVFFSYATVWLPATDKVLVNAIPASIRAPVRTVAAIDPDAESGLSSVFNIQNPPRCTIPSAMAYRTLLDSAYGLAPAISCVQFVEDESFKVVVVRGAAAGSSQLNSCISNTSSLEEQLSFPFNVSKVLPLPLQSCSKAPLMMADVANRRMCNQGRCITFSFSVRHNSTADDLMNSTSSVNNHTGIEALKSMLTVLNDDSSQCSMPTTSGGFIINMTACNAPVLQFLDYSNIQPVSSLSSLSFSGASKWVSEQGSNTNDFKYAADPEESVDEACHMLLDSPSLYTSTTGNVTPPEEIKIQAMAYLTSYLTEHHAAFTTDKGPATDPYTFYALIISTALSVITIAVPFTNLMLRGVCRVCPCYLNPASRMWKGIKIIVQVCSNVVLSLAFLLPVLSLARNERDREQPFSTWALASNDLVLCSGSIRVFYLFSATSKYRSHFLASILLMLCLTCGPVAACTARRCFQVFQRYELLCQLHRDDRTSVKGSLVFTKAVEAIEMGDAEYRLLLQQYNTDIKQVAHESLAAGGGTSVEILTVQAAHTPSFLEWLQGANLRRPA